MTPRNDIKDRQYYDRIREIKDLERPLPWLDVVPKRYVKLDREMKTKLQELVKDRPDLVNVLFRLRTDYRARKASLTSRRMLVAMYASLAINQSISEVVSLKSISTMNWKGDKNAEEFFTEFQKRYTMMQRTEGALTDNQVRDLLHLEMSKSTGVGSLEAELRDWEKTYKKSERTLQNLLQCYRDWMMRKQPVSYTHLTLPTKA